MSLLAVAHRAGNSLPRLHAAVDLGADVVEADVHRHRGRLEVRHLKTMGPLPWLWDRWELVPAAAPRFPLGDLLAASGAGTTLMLDLKGRNPAVGHEVARALREAPPAARIVVCSRNWAALSWFGDLSQVRTVWSARNRTELALLRRRLRAGPPGYGVSVHRSLLTPAVVAELHRRVEVVMTWPVNEAAHLAHVLRLTGSGVVGVISDEPGILRSVLTRQG